jgi:hypothetical protein
MASSESVKGLLKGQTLKETKLTLLDKVLCQWFTAVHSKRNPMNGPVIIENAKSCYDCAKITDMFTFSEGSNKKLPVRTYVSIGTV